VGKSVTLGATPNASTITLEALDGIGKTLIFSPSGGSTTIVNDVIQDGAAGGGTASGRVQFAGSTGRVTKIAGLNTYTGGTLLNASSTVQLATDYHTGDPSAPFGVGTLTANNGTNNILQPIGGDRTIANPVSMLFGVTVANASSDSSSLTFSGPVSMSTTGRFLTNNFIGGTLTLGLAASPSTFTLPTTGGQTATIAGTGTTVINDGIQNGAGSPSPATVMAYSGTGTLTLNGLNTYFGDTSITGLGENVQIGSDSNALPGATFTAGPFGTGNLILNNTTTPIVLQPAGADRTVSNAITLSSGFSVANVAGAPHNLTLAGPITLGATNRIISNNIPTGASLTLGSATTPSTFTIGSTITIQSQLAGAGSTIMNDKLTGVGGLTVQGGAVLQLINAANDYAGTTLVSGTGTKLLVNGAKTGAGAITVNPSGTLGGTGSIAGAITNSGTIAPGVGVGTLTTTGNVAMATNSHLAIELGGGTADKLVVGGNLDLSNADFLDISGSRSGVSFVIASYTGTLTGTFNNVTAGYTVN
jgi:fibronectin-binding autotransporter adhesin